MVYGTVDVSVYTKAKTLSRINSNGGQENQHQNLANVIDDDTIPPPLRDARSLIENGLVFPVEKTLLKSVTPESEPLCLTPGLFSNLLDFLPRK